MRLGARAATPICVWCSFLLEIRVALVLPGGASRPPRPPGLVSDGRLALSGASPRDCGTGGALFGHRCPVAPPLAARRAARSPGTPRYTRLRSTHEVSSPHVVLRCGFLVAAPKTLPRVAERVVVFSRHAIRGPRGSSMDRPRRRVFGPRRAGIGRDREPSRGRSGSAFDVAGLRDARRGPGRILGRGTHGRRGGAEPGHGRLRSGCFREPGRPQRRPRGRSHQRFVSIPARSHRTDRSRSNRRPGITRPGAAILFHVEHSG